MSLAESAIEAENFAAAKRLASIALTSARKIRDNGLAKAATQRVSEIQSLEKAFIEVEGGSGDARRESHGPEANLEVGVFKCYHAETGTPVSDARPGQ